MNGGRFCEAVARGLYQLDTGRVSHRKSVGDVRGYFRDQNHSHKLNPKDRSHIERVIGVVYKFRSDRGVVHISKDYTANNMDAMLVLHACKWLFAEFLRLAWEEDRKTIAETIAQIVQIEDPLIHVLDGAPLILDPEVSGPEEVLLLLNHAPTNRLTESDLYEQIANNTRDNVRKAVDRLKDSNEIRRTENEIALTPRGRKRIMEEILPKYSNG